MLYSISGLRLLRKDSTRFRCLGRQAWIHAIQGTLVLNPLMTKKPKLGLKFFKQF